MGLTHRLGWSPPFQGGPHSHCALPGTGPPGLTLQLPSKHVKKAAAACMKQVAGEDVTLGLWTLYE